MFGSGVRLEQEEKTSKFMDAGIKNYNEEKGIW